MVIMHSAFVVTQEYLCSWDDIEAEQQNIESYAQQKRTLSLLVNFWCLGVIIADLVETS